MRRVVMPSLLIELSLHQPADCVPWPGKGRDRNGYATTSVGGKTVRVHRYAYERLVGPILPDLTIDHLCFNRECMNPTHLEAVERSENTRRTRVALGDTCRRGHTLTLETTYFPPPQKKGGKRRCRICLRENARRAYWRAKAKPDEVNV